MGQLEGRIMTVDDRVVTYLTQNMGKAFCDACLCRRVIRPKGGHINNTQASNATRPLRNVDGFQVSPGECSACGEYRQKVTKAS